MTYPPQGSGVDDPVADPYIESFYTHFGATDAFWATSVTGNGTATHVTAFNHYLSQTVGVGAIGYSRLYSVRNYSLNSHSSIMNWVVRAHTTGVGGVRKTCIGMKAVTTTASLLDSVMFFCDSTGQWSTVTGGAASSTSNNIAAISDNDLLTIVVDASEAKFYVNGTLVQSHTTNISIADLYTVGLVIAEDANVTTTRTLQIEMMNWEEHY